MTSEPRSSLQESLPPVSELHPNSIPVVKFSSRNSCNEITIPEVDEKFRSDLDNFHVAEAVAMKQRDLKVKEEFQHKLSPNGKKEGVLRPQEHSQIVVPKSSSVQDYARGVKKTIKPEDEQTEQIGCIYGLLNQIGEGLVCFNGWDLHEPTVIYQGRFIRELPPDCAAFRLRGRTEWACSRCSSKVPRGSVFCGSCNTYRSDKKNSTLQVQPNGESHPPPNQSDVQEENQEVISGLKEEIAKNDEVREVKEMKEMSNQDMPAPFDQVIEEPSSPKSTPALNKRASRIISDTALVFGSIIELYGTPATPLDESKVNVPTQSKNGARLSAIPPPPSESRVGFIELAEPVLALESSVVEKEKFKPALFCIMPLPTDKNSHVGKTHLHWNEAFVLEAVRENVSDNNSDTDAAPRMSLNNKLSNGVNEQIGLRPRYQEGSEQFVTKGELHLSFTRQDKIPLDTLGCSESNVTIHIVDTNRLRSDFNDQDIGIDTYLCCYHKKTLFEFAQKVHPMPITFRVVKTSTI